MRAKNVKELSKDFKILNAIKNQKSAMIALGKILLL